MLNTSVIPPQHYKVNVTVRECCFGFMTVGDSCMPMCKNVCINSHCIGNNKCKCHSGYYPVDNFRCLPKCEPECGKNMACLAPDKCVCKPDYKRVNESYCEPTCSFTADNFDCINAKCVGLNECECWPGFRTVSEFQCEPICSQGCANGECMSPDNCECLMGYEKNSNGTCKPLCDPPCINGDCVAPNSCECHRDFEEFTKKNECLEKSVIKDLQSCIKSCKHGTCSEDARCVCEDGFEMFNGKCLKVCDKQCDNGRCLEDQCVCPPQFKLSENATSCLPICSFEEGHDCIYGTCVAPNRCQCFEGFKFLDDRNCTCVPMCDPMCINGVCTENGCKCHETFFNISNNVCIKNCSVGFTWMYDECVEESSFELFEDGENVDATSTATDAATDETTGDIFTSQDETSESFQIFVDNEEESFVIMKSSVQPLTMIRTFLSIITILIASILITFCVLYRRITAKNVYCVEEQGELEFPTWKRNFLLTKILLQNSTKNKNFKISHFPQFPQKTLSNAFNLLHQLTTGTRQKNA